MGGSGGNASAVGPVGSLGKRLGSARGGERRARKRLPTTTARPRIHQRFAALRVPGAVTGDGSEIRRRLSDERTLAKITPHLGQPGASTSA
jgi:hypothetical protein